MKFLVTVGCLNLFLTFIIYHIAAIPPALGAVEVGDYVNSFDSFQEWANRMDYYITAAAKKKQKKKRNMNNLIDGVFKHICFFNVFLHRSLGRWSNFSLTLFFWTELDLPPRKRDKEEHVGQQKFAFQGEWPQQQAKNAVISSTNHTAPQEAV